jgi:hypothetical protein
MLDRAEIIAGLQAAATWSGFAASLHRTYTLRGDLTHSQWASAEGMITKLQANAAHKAREGKAIDASRIESLLATAAAAGLKAPKFRAEGLTFSIAGPASRNAGAVYVKGGGVYFGKISGGQFVPSRDAAAGTGEAVARIAADPTAAAVAYGRLTGSCSCCGRTLSDPASVALGIGPICADRWGL